MSHLIEEIKQCTICKDHLPHGPRPVLQFNEQSKVVIIGQAPGSKVHKTGIPWDDQSGKLLRSWLQCTEEEFYNPDLFALIPMGFCYPGKGKSGDLPPRPECAETWQDQVFEQLKSKKLIVLIGQYAQKHYLGNQAKKNLTETVFHWSEYLPTYFPIPHPSPRNRFWFQKNQWFNDEALPHFQSLVGDALGSK